MKKLIETDDGCLWIENNIGYLLRGVFIHWDIYKWSPSAVKYYKQVWNEVIAKKLKDKYGNIYAVPPSEFEEKLIKMFGFEDTGLLWEGNRILKYP